jgi:ATP-dependent DNA helicase RecG
VGPQRAELLEKLGLHRAMDLLFFFPRDYQDLTDRRKIADLEEGTLQTVLATVHDIEMRNTRRGPLLSVIVEDESACLKALWFNQAFLRKRFAPGRRLLLAGKPKQDDLLWIMNHPKITFLSDHEEDEVPLEPILPIYRLTEGLGQHHLRRIMRPLLKELVPFLEETFPEDYLVEHDLWPIQRALPAIHFPVDQASLQHARRRFVYQELLILQLALAIRRLQHRTSLSATGMEVNSKIDARIRSLFPFELTGAQQNAIEEISRDMQRPIPMNRLLQGDVGSGKTVVALYAILLAIANNHQAVFMAPTEVLARQHLRTLKHFLAGSRVVLAPLFGGQRPRERARILQSIASGEANLIVGTQAILQGNAEFHRLGLVVIDEQHKFGVRQRAQLRTAKADPHYLVMTATPIPRSVTMTLFGDLDISIIDELPPGRQKVSTYLAGEDQREKWWDFFREKIRGGRQGYIVVPLVEESEQLQAANMENVYESLTNGPLEAFRLGLIHGRMKTEEKEAVMADFRSGEIQVLVCTSVIEVGVDVPNASLMVIESGERFGLAQLHQLRGRIGRGRHRGHCAVFADLENPLAEKRLKAFVHTHDGFQLAEKDFRLRGPGELFGTQQHGMPPLRIANLIDDRPTLDEARQDAFDLVRTDPGLAQEKHDRLRRMVLARYGKVLDLGDVG